MASGTEILVLAGTVSSAFSIFAANRGLKMRDDKRPFAELLWYSGGLVPLASICLIWASMGEQPIMPQRVILFIVGAAIGGCALLAAGEILRPVNIVQAQTPTGGGIAVPNSNSIGTIHNNQGIITQGQIGGTNVVVPKPPPRSIDEDFRNFIRANFPDKSKEMAPMVLTGDDEPERSNFASQIEEFLKSDGYKVKPRVYFLSPGGTPMGVVIDQFTEPNVILIKVGVNTRS
ncbi:DUF2339 domain-containing protein [Bradyrhizobium sp. OK095]|uniref:DUF2339 domain-containing protein n=1 Tax=Bradyrhizobium sp. OK095 TaxID=1882760 RepID=UPI0008D1BB37|nr:DUF2339 domain-containing protein [Bradyrhizobium sp. OK095]SEN11355.1 hypothetical protein SAMN05443254_10694 [Bradyrhizobium sp. OK095]